MPSLRDWLTRKQRETRRGRAELRLTERAAAWNTNPDPRFLPTWLEWLGILLFARRRDRTAAQQHMMRSASRRRMLQGAAALAAVVLAAGAAYEIRGRVKAQSIVGRLLVAPLGEARSIAAELAPYRGWSDRALSDVLSPANGAAFESERLRAAVGLLAVDAAQEERVFQAMSKARPDDTRALVAILEGRHGRWVEPLWRELAGGAQPEGRLRAAMALAAYDPPAGAAARWHEHAAFVAEQMLAEARQDPSQYEPLVAAFTPAAGVLAAPLTEFFYNAARDAKGELAASVLARYASNEPATLAELVADAQDVQFKALYPVLAERFAGPARGTLERIVREGPPAALPADQRVRLGRRRAALAAVLARQGRRDEAFDALRVGDDPESRTQFIHRSREMGVTAAELDDCVNRADELRQSKTGDERRIDDGVLYGLLLALGEYELSDLPAERRDPMVQQLADWYAHDPSSAVHGAAGWLLWRWNQVDYVMKVDQTPLAYSPDREWFVVEFAPQVVEQKQEADGAKSAGPTEDQQGADAPRAQPPAVSPPFYITFVVFPAGEYLIGSPPDESDHIANEVLHRVRLTRAFALSDREITWEQFTPFGVWHHDRWQEQFHHELGVDDPAFGMTWYEGAAFCRWLGECAQMSGLEQAYADPKSLDPKEYPPDPDPNAGGAPRDWPVEPSKHGFRLPSNAEWEAACRCGTLSAYSFGNDRELLAHYAWNADNSALFFEDRQKWSHRVGRLRPNARGLFDMHGNLFEWCHDWYGDYAEGEDLIGTKTGVSRVRRGGAFPDVAANCRSAYRDGYQPTSRWAFLGLRVLLVPK